MEQYVPVVAYHSAYEQIDMQLPTYGDGSRDHHSSHV